MIFRFGPFMRAQKLRQFLFVAKLEAAGSKVTGVANKARYSYWLATFRYMRAIADTNCAWADYNTAMTAVKKDKAQAKSLGLPARNALMKNTTVMITQLQ